MKYGINSRSNIFKYLVFENFQGRNLSNILFVFQAMRRLNIFISRFHDLYKGPGQHFLSVLLSKPFNYLSCSESQSDAGWGECTISCVIFKNALQYWSEGFIRPVPNSRWLSQNSAGGSLLNLGGQVLNIQLFQQSKKAK